MPPDPAQVEAHIKDRLCLTELNSETIANLIASNDFFFQDEESVQELQEEHAAAIRAANKSYYNSLALFESTIKDDEAVNIVIPVYNSIHLVDDCIRSVVKNTRWPHRITLVDDASDAYTNTVLQGWANAYPNQITLITNRKNKGFAASVNRGIKAFEGITKYTCLLNSDVLVTPMWLTKMVMALNADPRNKIVNPATNNTALINVPMNEGFSYQAMNASIEQGTSRRYPEIMPTGFCFMFPNSVLKTIGYMDEAYANFGEETDWWMRVVSYSDGKTFDRWRAVLADDTYVFHQRGASYATLGEEIHASLRRTASSRFRTAWPTFGVWNKCISVPKSIGPLKKKRGLKEYTAVTGNLKKPSICFVVHSAESCGAMHYIADIINEVNARGGDAKLAVVARKDHELKEPTAELREAPIVFKSIDDFKANFRERVFQRGVVIAATSELAPYVYDICSDEGSGLIPVLHVQSYEPVLVPADMLDNVKKNFDLIPNIISSSSWITKAMGKKVLDTINPGVDRKLFYPADRLKGDDRPTVTFVLNSNYPFKGSNRGVLVAQALNKLAQQDGFELRILAYGSNIVNGAPEIVCQGVPARTRISRLLNTETDIFVDPALNHSYGMPALEAIAAGVPVVGWDNQGIREYLPKGYTDEDYIFPNTTPPAQMAQRIYELLKDEGKRKAVAETQAKAALIKNHDRKVGVAKFIECIDKNFGAKASAKKIVVVTPHLRKHGGPTTILTLANELARRGHDVSVATVYSDINPEVVRYTDLPVVLLKETIDNLPECDLLITNSDNPLNPAFSQTKKAKRKILLKLSHNPRFKALEEMGLNCKWDAIVTSSQWLADVCENVTPGWNYKPTKATRIGWFHYNFPVMRRNIKRKKFPGEDSPEPVVLSTLIHAHPSKGSAEASMVFLNIKKQFGDRVHMVGIGEVPPQEVKINIPDMEYIYSPGREELADLFFKTDIWLGCSHTEGLGRMALEAMTGAAACVLTDTGAEFVEHGNNALVAPVGDIQSLSSHIHSLIVDPKLRQEIATNGYYTAKKKADPTDLGDRLEKVIQDVF